ncbi:MAG: hypothetical protein A2138_10555 [Deltaproteobacteria bacterium RBG_16_71_12]|nr:MAG: hypothetical protein A2138_10555 [Deltaproteobacteria bacterium RBG_16_71_12]
MRIVTLIVVLSATAPLAGFGCPDKPISTCEAMMRAQCEFAFRCCDAEERLDGSAPVGLAGGYVTSEGECVDRAIGACKLFAGVNEDSVALGRMTFDGEAANACLAGMNAARDQCDWSQAQLVQRAGQACSRALGVGAVEPGDTCATSAECRLGGTCEIDYEDPDVNEDVGAIEGECADAGDDGDDCTDRPCGPGLLCNDGECEPTPAEGDDCFGGAVCGPGLYCDNNECTVPKNNGDDCEQSYECLSGECEDGECAGAGICNGA